jgi:probable rRNA maturation factor
MLLSILDHLDQPAAELSFIIVDDAAMADLHQQYSGVSGTTDVLTFDLSEPPSSLASSLQPLEGEIYLCLDEARRRAAERAHDVNRELLLYALHGVLHLLGYDDHTPSDHRRMHAEEDRLLRLVGVGPVFHRPGERSK